MLWLHTILLRRFWHYLIIALGFTISIFNQTKLSGVTKNVPPIFKSLSQIVMKVLLILLRIRIIFVSYLADI